MTLVAPAGTGAPLPLVQSVPPEVSIGAATRRAEDPLSAVSTLHERSDGSVVVLDTREGAVYLIGANGQRKALGRQGGGPGEYSLPISVIGLPGDTSLIADAGKRVFHVVTPDGAMRTTLPWPESAGLGLAAVRGIDARGRVYFIADAWKVAEQSIGGETQYRLRGDSIPLERWDRRTGRVESVAMLRITSPDDDNERRVAIRSNAVPFVARDEASVAPDGQVNIVRARPYTVDVLGVDGRLRSGQPIPYSPLRVTEEDKNAIRQARRGSRFLSTNTQNAAPNLAADPPWNDFKPPFRFGRSVLTAPDGTTWVERTRAHNDLVPRYDRFGVDGRRIAVVRLPAGSRVVAFARDGIWLAREDDDGLLWLSKHPNLTGDRR